MWLEFRRVLFRSCRNNKKKTIFTLLHIQFLIFKCFIPQSTKLRILTPLSSEKAGMTPFMKGQFPKYMLNCFIQPFFIACQQLWSSLIIPTGLVDAHTGEVVKTWNGLQHHNIRAITGNENIGKGFVDIDVEKTGRYSCKHRDAKRRVEVS